MRDSGTTLDGIAITKEKSEDVKEANIIVGLL